MEYAGGYTAKGKFRNRTSAHSLPWVAAGSHSLWDCFSAKTNVKDSERSMEFIGFYIFRWHHIRLDYAGIVQKDRKQILHKSFSKD